MADDKKDEIKGLDAKEQEEIQKDTDKTAVEPNNSSETKKPLLKKLMLPGLIGIGVVVVGLVLFLFVFKGSEESSAENPDQEQTTEVSETKHNDAEKSSLEEEKADEHNSESIAFPAFGTGLGKFPVELCAETMIKAIKKYIDGASTRIKRIILVSYDDLCYDDFVHNASLFKD